MTWVVYLLHCRDATYYCGITNDLVARVHAHNSLPTGAKYTRGRRPVTLVYAEECADRSHAQRREHEIKQMTREQKQALIAMNTTAR